MTKIEKIVLIFIGVLVIALGFTIHSLFSKIEESGGMRNVIVETGKEVKGIINEVSENEKK